VGTFDLAVERLNQAGPGDILADLLAAHAGVAETAGALADALEALASHQPVKSAAGPLVGT
jgi:hypothetical protein